MSRWLEELRAEKARISSSGPPVPPSQPDSLDTTRHSTSAASGTFANPPGEARSEETASAGTPLLRTIGAPPPELREVLRRWAEARGWECHRPYAGLPIGPGEAQWSAWLEGATEAQVRYVWDDICRRAAPLPDGTRAVHERP
jgi:hypothetical protein